MGNETRVRVVVLDGVDWEYAHAHRADLPNLWGMACYAQLEACEAPVTSDAVAALLCGRDAKLHWKTNDRFTNSRDLIRERPWFGELASNGMTLALCNVPLTWPAFPVPGKGSWLTSGYPITQARQWHFGPLVPAVIATYPIVPILADSCGGPGGSPDLAMLVEAEDALVSWFLNAPRCTVEILWLRSSDSAGHHAWGSPAYDTVLQHLDRQVGRLGWGADNLVVISDHGFDHVDSPRCAAYHATEHGPTTRAAGLVGAHTMDGVLFAGGTDIHRHGRLPRQRLLEVAGGVFDLLGIPPAPGMVSAAPVWATPTTPEEDDRIRASLKALGYVG